MRVFITQIPHRKDPKTGAFVPSVNVNPAAEFGELIELMPPRAAFFATNDLRKQIEVSLKDFDFENDSLLTLGDPVVCAVSVAELARRGSFFVLRWDKNIGRYTKLKIH